MGMTTRSMSRAAAEGDAAAADDEALLRDYVLGEKIGAGTYGNVWAATCRLTGGRVAIKRVHGVFGTANTVSQVVRELALHRVVEAAGGRGAVARLLDVALPVKPSCFDRVSMVFERFETTLADAMKKGSDDGARWRTEAARGLLTCVARLHACGIAHRDLKPDNVLVGEGGERRVALCDLGMARGWDDDAGDAEEWTDYVTARWYRAPEVLLGLVVGIKDVSGGHRHPSAAADMWSVGCILAELLGGLGGLGCGPIAPGRDTLQQAWLVGGLLGPLEGPTLAWYEARRDHSTATYVEAYRALLETARAFPQLGGLRKALGNAPKDVFELVAPMLSYDPSARPTAAEALLHPFFIGTTSEAPPPATLPAARPANDATAEARKAGSYCLYGPNVLSALRARIDVHRELMACKLGKVYSNPCT